MFIFADFFLIFGSQVKTENFAALRNFAGYTVAAKFRSLYCSSILFLVFGALCTILSFMIYIYINSHGCEISQIANFCNLPLVSQPNFVLTITFSFELRFKCFWYRWKA